MAGLVVEPLTRAAFAPFGEIIEIEGAERRLINGGTTERFHGLATSETDADGATIVSLFRGQPRSFPFRIEMMERHPEGSQAFYPLSGRPWMLAVADDAVGVPGVPRVFLAGGTQGVNYGRNVWHHPLIALESVSNFLVVDREGSGTNLEEFFYDVRFWIERPEVSKP